jgi:hypothetical protein
MERVNPTTSPGDELNSSNSSGAATSSATTNVTANASQNESVDATRVMNAINEILVDMNQGACAETITQTVQIITLANGKKAAVRVLITTDSDLFM